MSIRSHISCLVVLLAAGLICSSSAPAAAAPPAPSAAIAKVKKPAISKKKRAKIRRELRRQMQRNPASVLRPAFVKKATLVDFTLPLTVRLGQPVGINATPDDQIEIEWDDSIDPWPQLGTLPAPAQTVTLTAGTFTLEADFSDDASGSGELGAIQTRGGMDADIRATPFDIASDPNCVDGLGNPSPARVQALRDASIASPQPPRLKFTAGGSRYGLLNMFSQKIRGSIMLKTSFVSSVSDSSCSAPVEAGVAATQSPAFPLRYNGDFHLSPAITSDGKMRLGKIVIDDATLPQAASIAKFSACTTAADPCDELMFTAHVKVKHLTADVLLGDIRSSS